MQAVIDKDKRHKPHKWSTLPKVLGEPPVPPHGSPPVCLSAARRLALELCGGRESISTVAFKTPLSPHQRLNY